MEKVKGIVNRLVHEDKQTLSRLHIYKGVNEIFKCAILELPDRNNKNRISRICSGVYQCVLRWSRTYAWHYHIKNVEGRSLILIHFGNYYWQTEGCLLAGNDFKDINKDGYRDVTNSRKTMQRLLKVAPKEFELLIHDM